MRWLLASIFCGLVAIPSVTNADVWRCEGNTFTSNPNAAESCNRFAGSRVCGSGSNRFFTPERVGLSDDSRCEAMAPARSPLWGAPVERGSSSSQLWNWERKLQPTLSLNFASPSIENDFAEELEELQKFLTFVPGGSRVLEAINQNITKQ